MNNQTQRLAFIDIAKGLGIVAVVAGHIYPPGIVHSLLYLFHMPLFFFISGYLFKAKDDKGFVPDKLKQLIIPYFSFLLVVYTIQNLAYFSNPAFCFSGLASLYGKALLGGRWLYGYTTAFWFVPVLFSVLVATNWLVKKVHRRILVVLGIASLTAACLNSLFFPSLKIPLNANVALAAFPLFLAGYFFKQRGIKNRPVIGCLVLTLALVLAFYHQLPAMDMKNAVYGVPLLSFAAAIAVSLLVFSLSQLIAEKLPVPARLLNTLGQASLVIMFLHQPVQILLQNHGLENCHARTLLSLLLPYLVYRAFKTNALCRALFLGVKEEWVTLFAKWQAFVHYAFRGRKQKVNSALLR